MDTPEGTKLNRLINTWVRGTVTITSILNNKGYSNELLSLYKRSNWIESVGPGAYKLKGDTVDWTGALYTLQTQNNLSCHPGGKTALILQGYTHYVASSITTLFLYSLPGEKLPLWFKKFNRKPELLTTATNLFSKNDGLTEYSVKDYSIKISLPERAALEMLYYVPQYQSFDEAARIFENLTMLRFQTVQSLLEDCNSIKAKRIFLYLAELCNHQWFSKINFSKINLGSGKRVIVENGKLDNKYLITVPATNQQEIP